jgi:hypothetical protein
MKTILKRFLYLGYIHEAFHYFAARSFGLKAKIYPTYTSYKPIPDKLWKHLLIVAAPIMGFIPLVILTWIDLTFNLTGWRNLTRWLNFLIALSLLGTCLTDFAQIRKLISGRRNHDC